MMQEFNPNLCYSIKSKKCLNEQCTNKIKEPNKLCGKHINTKNIILYQDIYNQKHNISINIVQKEVYKTIEESFENESVSSGKNRNIYDRDDLIKIIVENKQISVYSLRKSIKNCYFDKFINTKMSKQNIIKELKILIEKEKNYILNELYVINIQKMIRGWIIRKKTNCSNQTDILTFDTLYNIPYPYFYVFCDKITNKSYGYDIRTLIQIVESNYVSCPYTFRNFTDEEIISIKIHKTYLENKGYTMKLDKVVLTPEEEINMKIKDLFYQINMLDNYTDPEWFKALNINQLISLYSKMEDIWNYRTQMTIESKMNIVQNGIAFDIPLTAIRSCKNKMKLQNILLDEFYRIINEGVNREEKKLGAILILSGLVEVSHDASYALPHLLQMY